MCIVQDSVGDRRIECASMGTCIRILLWPSQLLVPQAVKTGCSLTATSAPYGPAGSLQKLLTQDESVEDEMIYIHPEENVWSGVTDSLLSK
jgi:hypothetical protein